jgi:iron uptake system EfeUOB component EfeO/EfeM
MPGRDGEGEPKEFTMTTTARHTMQHSVATVAGTAALLLTAAGCGSSSSQTTKVIQSEWIFTADPMTAKAGKVTISAKNLGGFEHEVVLVKAADPKELPTKADGTVDEEKITEAQKVGEVEHIAPNSSKKTTFTLEAGKYVMFCNLVEKDGTSHFAKGMSGTFTVT